MYGRPALWHPPTAHLFTTHPPSRPPVPALPPHVLRPPLLLPLAAAAGVLNVLLLSTAAPCLARIRRNSRFWSVVAPYGLSSLQYAPSNRMLSGG